MYKISSEMHRLIWIDTFRRCIKFLFTESGFYLSTFCFRFVFEDFVHGPNPDILFNSVAESENEAVVAREGNTKIYLLGGISGFTALLLVTAIVILILRQRHNKVIRNHSHFLNLKQCSLTVQ